MESGIFFKIIQEKGVGESMEETCVTISWQLPNLDDGYMQVDDNICSVSYIFEMLHDSFFKEAHSNFEFEFK